MAYFLTLNWYKTKNRKNTKLSVSVIDFTRLGGFEKNLVGSEKNQGGSEKGHFIFCATGIFIVLLCLRYWSQKFRVRFITECAL